MGFFIEVILCGHCQDVQCARSPDCLLFAEFIPAFVCMEGKDGKPRAEAEACASKHSLDWAKINSCAQSDEGSKLALDAAQVTQAPSEGFSFFSLASLNSPLYPDALSLVCVCLSAFLSLHVCACETCLLLCVYLCSRYLYTDSGPSQDNLKFISRRS